MARQPTPLSALMTSAQGGGTPYLSDRGANGAAFGLGVTNALAGLGDGIMRAADSWAKQEIEKQSLANESAARDAATAYRTQTIEAWATYGTTQGKAAVDGWGGFQKQMRDTHDGLLAGLPNDQARMMARRQMDGWYGQMLQSSVLHRQKEDIAWSLESSKGAAAQAVADANLNRQNFDRAHADIERAVGEKMQAAELTGTPPELMRVQGMVERGQAWRTVLSNLAGEGNAGAMQADAMFRRVRDTMDPVSQQQIQDALQPKVLQARADGVVRSVLGLGEASAGGEAGYRNNIGNLVVSPASWEGKGTPYKAFETFRTPEEGVAANTKNFRKIVSGIGEGATLQDVARKWAPDDDGKTPLLRGNDSKAWAARVGGMAGIDPRAPINVNDPDQMTAIMRAMNEHEHGRRTVPDAAYRSGVEAALSGKPAAGSLPQGPPTKDMVQTVYMMTQGDPELQRAAVSQMQSHVNVFNTANTQAKKELGDDLKNRQAALMQGEAIEIPEVKIRQVDPDNADALIGELKSAQTMGQAFKAAQLASPDQIAATRADIENGTGIISGLLREGTGIKTQKEKQPALFDLPGKFDGKTANGNINLMNRPSVQNEDGTVSSVRSMSVNIDGQEVLIPTVSEDGRVMSDEEAVRQFERTGKNFGKFATPEQATAYADALHNQQASLGDFSEADKAKDIAMRARALDAFDKVIAERNTAIKKDPTAYLMSKDTNVRAAWDVLQRNKNEDGWGQFAAANLAAQERLGLSAGEQKILPASWRKNIVESVQMQDPKLAGEFMVKMERETGKYWPQVFGELTTGENKLPGSYVALGVIQDPVARTTYANLLQAEKANSGTVRKALAARDKDAPKAVEQQVSGEMTDFMSTFSRGRGGIVMATALNESASLLAMGFMSQGMSQADAVSRATQSILSQFDVEVSERSHIGRAPKGMGPDMVAATNVVRSGLVSGSLFQYGDRTGVYSTEATARAVERNARQGTWVTSPDYKGWTLLGADGDVVLLRDGSPVTVPFEDAKRIREQGRGEGIRETPAPASLGIMPVRPSGYDPRGMPAK
jgi:hypothetical protein